jgi:hypothetical protein
LSVERKPQKRLAAEDWQVQAVASVDWVRGVAVVRGERARRAMVMRAKTIFAILVGVGERFLRGCEDLVAWVGVSWCERSGMSKGGGRESLLTDRDICKIEFDCEGKETFA